MNFAMKKGLLLASFGLFLGFFGCKKVDITTDGEVVFFVKSDTPGDTTANFEAGKNGYYLWTDYARPDDSGGLPKLRSYRGSFETVSHGGPKLTFIFYDSDSVGQSPEVLKIGLLPFRGVPILPVSDGYDYTFYGDSSAGTKPLAWSWQIDNETFTESIVTIHSADSSFTRLAHLEIQDATDRRSSMTQTAQFVGEFNYGCWVNMFFEEPNTLGFVARTAPSSWLWSADSILSQAQFFPIDTAQKNYSIVAEFNNCGASHSVELGKNGSVDWCNARFGVVGKKRLFLPNLPELIGKVDVIYTNEKGVKFSSFLQIPQPATSFFEITSVNEYDRNEQGQKTKKLGIRFSADLKAENGEVISLKNRSGVIGVAYPD